MSVTKALGFTAAGIAAGIKENGNPDLGLVRNLGPDHTAAAVFTSNRVKAAPVLWSEQVIKDHKLQAVILNSGGANACTGPDGFADTHQTAETVAAGLEIGAIDVAVCSTGLIGTRLPMNKITEAVPTLIQQATPEGGADAARAIMTTDTHPKQAVAHGDGWVIGGMAKGAGMLAPGLATMLVVITTDAVIGADDLDSALRTATGATFDRLDSDGCMSTNDTVIAMASGASGVDVSWQPFTAALTTVCHELAQQLLGDAEGASHQISINVRGAASEQDAITVGRTIARNNLFKCAVFGQDPNWGRVLAAIGTTDAIFEPDHLDVSFNKIKVCIGGSIGEPRELVDLSGRAVEVEVDLHAGEHETTIWTNDLTYDYVKENAEYSS
ncbi:bifunctional glutamate N-acetyltransferase/amino-acid acetyltransferase ArgJ [Microlunatus elymi]|uniref:Arginine biosynthesis bifunctional protein ArgJ n=1 Tax=Microlunatus elymi TaxID=2596828 RepID=A0A516PY01_9ACTN|nr:bifunctional glutamate N-acetyltransferase/amino-acid acetyltransferase ArgJ [Microlunatus elymi]QDP96058.1 bifunctional glutamate N-acetyltransferase/amino-acid acetyltransferase ArgJ [Microlunatus elymi]